MDYHKPGKYFSSRMGKALLDGPTVFQSVKNDRYFQ